MSILILMSKSKRAQIPMDPDEYEKLRLMAEKSGMSVAEVVRQAVGDLYSMSVEKNRREAALEKLFALPTIKVGDWKDLKKEIADRRGSLLS
jgi:hypothetical protein